ncbi:hypothetical protein H8692_05715 [Mogibacterium sp. NSJ-24]|uniref:Uncharacterized protein n=1 Tax=Lentihominibacter hominis TaxID=2763645 RepID=A0A926I8M0_9FIRM|nr:hypothetical protein [Lentihominibacter hominis]MBC8568261.1 hypothetical protein [Lentihominibacter hominis]
MDWQMLMAIGGGIVLLGNVASVVKNIVSPGFRLKDMVDRNREAIDRLKRHEQNDFQALEEIRNMNRTQCVVMIQMLNHLIDGNHVEKMKETRKKLQDLLADIEK